VCFGLSDVVILLRYKHKPIDIELLSANTSLGRLNPILLSVLIVSYLILIELRYFDLLKFLKLEF